MCENPTFTLSWESPARGHHQAFRPPVVFADLEWGGERPSPQREDDGWTETL